MDFSFPSDEEYLEHTKKVLSKVVCSTHNTSPYNIKVKNTQVTYSYCCEELRVKAEKVLGIYYGGKC